jgi:reductive dehalogenase
MCLIIADGLHTYQFLQYLGYQFLGDGGDNGTPFIEGSAAALTGVGENSRQNMYTITPEYGNMGRIHNFLTDLPLAPSKPIDAGIWRFCHSCTKCAKLCPSQSLSYDSQPSYELPQIEGKPNLLHNPGTKMFWGNSALCTVFRNELGAKSALTYGGATVNPELVSMCTSWCFGNCTFTQDQGAMIHAVIKGTIPTTGIFNGFLAKMSETFGYGVDTTNQAAEDWWDRSLPVFGVDTTRVALDNGYARSR